MSDSGRGGLLGGEYPTASRSHPGPAPSSSSSGGGYNVYSVPGGGRIISWQEPNPNYDPSNPDLMLLYKIGPYTTKTQYVADTGGGSGAPATLTPNTVFSEQHQDARSAADLAEQHRQYDETFGYNKARGDQTQQLAEGQALGMFRGQPTLGGQQMALDRDKFGFDQFKYISDLKANPRNFMQTFDVLRGFAPRVGSEQFGTQGNLPGYGLTSGGYAMPSFGAQSRATTPMRENVQPPVPQTGSPYDPNTDPNRGTRFEGLSGFNTDGTLRLAPNDPDAAGLMAKHPGQYRVGFAHGGVTPEPIVGRGVVSGRRYMIGEKGPEGIVPARVPAEVPPTASRSDGPLRSRWHPRIRRGHRRIRRSVRADSADVHRPELDAARSVEPVLGRLRPVQRT
jgi:hypothetical protein